MQVESQVKKLVEIATKSETSKRVFNALTKRERNRSAMNLRRVSEEIERDDKDFQVVPEELLNTFKELEQLGLGVLEISISSPPAFKWNVPVKEIADQVQQVLNPAKQDLEPSHTYDGMIAIPLDNGRKAYIDLPSDVSSNDLLRINLFLMQKFKR